MLEGLELGDFAKGVEFADAHYDVEVTFYKHNSHAEHDLGHLNQPNQPSCPLLRRVEGPVAVDPGEVIVERFEEVVPGGVVGGVVVRGRGVVGDGFDDEI